MQDRHGRNRSPAESASETISGASLQAHGRRDTRLIKAYLLYALFREANARTPEVRTMEVGTARTRLFKVGALVQATHRRIWFLVAGHWPGRDLLIAAAEAVRQHILRLQIVLL